ncbi:phytanoyl-CoA dioxygenase family protein [Aggregicoccus sp. 17bor-14]|uniref:phytanoyl-CoA dioxygenase family protein n=1 Tax=Myxococcaceae TaxID=31 RepID=UPI00351AA407
MSALSFPLSPEQCRRFAEEGYLVLPRMVDAATCAQLREEAQAHVRHSPEPAEYEADVAYPGAPASRDAEGGRTVRRLLQAHARGPLFAAWLQDARVLGAVSQLLGGAVKQARAHHNCVMTKQPRFSSDTGWHRDVRYWAFTSHELVTSWLALGREYPENGGLKVLPGTHTLTLPPEHYDAAQFLRPEVPENAALIARSTDVRLEPGDVLLFHARLFHAASRNHTAETKYSVVATYRRLDNLPKPGTRSAERD